MYGENYVQHMQARLGELGISKEAAIQNGSYYAQSIHRASWQRTSEPVIEPVSTSWADYQLINGQQHPKDV